MSDASNKNASGNGETDGKQAASDAPVKGTSSAESVVKEMVSATGSELPVKRSPSAGREASYVYDVLNLPSTVDTTGMRPNPRFEVKQQSTFGQDLQEQSKSADELVQRKESSYMYKEELAKIGKVTLPAAVVPPRSEKDGPEFRLSEDANKAHLFRSPWPWTAFASPEVVQKNLAAITEKKDRAVRVANEGILSGNDFTLLRERRLFANKRNTFFLGKYKRQLVLVKKVTSSATTVATTDPLWVSIAKRISYSQQMEEDKAVAKAQAMAAMESSVGSESTGTSINGTEEQGSSSSTASSEKVSAVSGVQHLPGRPFLQVYEIFRLESDRSLMVFMEIGLNKTLHNLVKRRTAVDVSQARLWSAQLLDGITYLVNHGVAHRALRLEHVLLDGELNARLIGWRRALPLTSGALTRRERRSRANNHLPPEAFLGSYEPASVDLWSWGVLLCALATFRYPFNVRTQRGSIEEEWAVFKARHPASGHAQVMALLDTLFLNDPEKRATLPTVQKSAWFGGSGGAPVLDSKQGGPEAGQVGKSASDQSLTGKNA
ncbi:Serine/threonine-protein kinase Chk1 [Tyrophagus putrescentiae]|nr:Serine/threonine-protein kinase Chk1 [Tyrophagus putrescentiae]